MIRTIALTFAALSICSVTTSANADSSIVYFKDVFPSQGTANCNSPRTTTTTVYTVTKSKVCIDHSSFIKTEEGGRVRVISANQMRGKPHYGAWFSEVNCKTMEKRSNNLWGFTTADMSSAAIKYKYAGWKKYGSTWISRSREGWSEWEPITNMTNEYKWICKQDK